MAVTVRAQSSHKAGDGMEGDGEHGAVPGEGAVKEGLFAVLLPT